MILGAEMALLTMGIYALFKGKLFDSKDAKTSVRGWPARIIGIICLLPIPLTVAVSSVVAAFYMAQGKPFTEEAFYRVATAIEAVIVLTCTTAVFILMYIYQTPNAPQDDAASQSSSKRISRGGI